MGRAENRRAMKAQSKQNKVYTLTQAQIDKIKDDAVTEASNTAFLLMLAIPVMVLHDKHWVKTAKQKIPKFVDQCLDLYDSFSKDLVTLEDLQGCLEEESGIKIERSNRDEKYY
jgi:hypothetical protein